MDRYKAVTAAVTELTLRTEALAKEPGVKAEVVTNFQKALQDLQLADGDLIATLTTQMMDELVPIGVEVIKRME